MNFIRIVIILFIISQQTNETESKKQKYKNNAEKNFKDKSQKTNEKITSKNDNINTSQELKCAESQTNQNSSIINTDNSREQLFINPFYQIDWTVYRIFNNTKLEFNEEQVNQQKKKVGIISQSNLLKNIFIQNVFNFQHLEQFSNHLLILDSLSEQILSYQEANNSIEQLQQVDSKLEQDIKELKANLESSLKKQKQIEQFANKFIINSSDIVLLLVDSFTPSAQLFLQKMFEKIDQKAQIIVLHYNFSIKQKKDLSDYENQLLQTNYIKKEVFKGINFFSQLFNTYQVQRPQQIIYHMILPYENQNEQNRIINELKIILDLFYQNRLDEKKINLNQLSNSFNINFKSSTEFQQNSNKTEQNIS